MRNFSIATGVAVCTIGFAQFASAADLPRKAPPPMAPPAPIYNWTGFYGGLNVGGTWGNNDVDTVSAPVQGFPGNGIGPGSYAFNSALGATGSVGNSGSLIGGGQIGYNWQFTTWVAGLEADIQGIVAHGDRFATSVGPFAFFGANEIITTQINPPRLDYLGTVRGRLGWLATPTLLVYGTGGLAYGHAKALTITQTNNDCAQFPGNCINTTQSSAGSSSKTLVGWTAGAGLEWMFAQRWSAKVEYLYYDLGSETFNSVLVTGGGTFFPGTSAVVASQSTTKFSGNVARVGLNYHF